MRTTGLLAVVLSVTLSSVLLHCPVAIAGAPAPPLGAAWIQSLSSSNSGSMSIPAITIQDEWIVAAASSSSSDYKPQIIARQIGDFTQASVWKATLAYSASVLSPYPAAVPGGRDKFLVVARDYLYGYSINGTKLFSINGNHFDPTGPNSLLTTYNLTTIGSMWYIADRYNFYGIDLSSGTQVIKKAATGANCQLSTGGVSQVFVPDNGNNKMRARSATDGTVAWEVNQGSHTCYTSAFLSSQSVVLCGGYDGHLAVYDATSGQTKTTDWKQPASGNGGAIRLPIVIDKGMVYVTAGSHFTAYNTSNTTNEFFFTKKIGSSTLRHTVFSFKRQVLYLAGGYSTGIVSVDLKTGTKTTLYADSSYINSESCGIALVRGESILLASFSMVIALDLNQGNAVLGTFFPPQGTVTTAGADLMGSTALPYGGFAVGTNHHSLFLMYFPSDLCWFKKQIVALYPNASNPTGTAYVLAGSQSQELTALNLMNGTSQWTVKVPSSSYFRERSGVFVSPHNNVVVTERAYQTKMSFYNSSGGVISTSASGYCHQLIVGSVNSTSFVCAGDQVFHFFHADTLTSNTNNMPLTCHSQSPLFPVGKDQFGVTCGRHLYVYRVGLSWSKEGSAGSGEKLPSNSFTAVPLTVRNTVIAADSYQTIKGYSSENGDEQWSQSTGYIVKHMATDEPNQQFIFSQTDNGVSCIEIDTGRVVWDKIRVVAPSAAQLTNILVGGGVVMVMSSNDLYGLDASTGDLLWSEFSFPYSFTGQGKIINGTIALLVTRTHLVGFQLRTGFHVYDLAASHSFSQVSFLSSQYVAYVDSNNYLQVLALPTIPTTTSAGNTLPPRQTLAPVKSSYVFAQLASAWDQKGYQGQGRATCPAVVVNNVAITAMDSAGYTKGNRQYGHRNFVVGRQLTDYHGTTAWYYGTAKSVSYLGQIPGTSNVFVIAYNHIIAIASNGTKLWQYNTTNDSGLARILDPSHYILLNYKPVIINNILYIGTSTTSGSSGNTELYAIDLRTGLQKWKSTANGNSNSQFATDGSQSLFVVSAGNSLQGYHLDSGTMTFQVSVSTSGMPYTCAYHSGNVYVGDTYGGFKVYEAQGGGKVDWPNAPKGSGVRVPMHFNGNDLYVMNGNHITRYSVESGANFGAVRWVYEGAYGDTITTVLFDVDAPSGGVMYVGSQTLTVLNLTNAKSTPVWRGGLGEDLYQSCTGLRFVSNKTFVAGGFGPLAVFNRTSLNLVALYVDSKVLGAPVEAYVNRSASYNSTLNASNPANVNDTNTALGNMLVVASSQGSHVVLSSVYCPTPNGSYWSRRTPSSGSFLAPPFVASEAYPAIFTFGQSMVYKLSPYDGTVLWQEATYGNVGMSQLGPDNMMYCPLNDVLVPPNAFLFATNGSQSSHYISFSPSEAQRVAMSNTCNVYYTKPGAIPNIVVANAVTGKVVKTYSKSNTVCLQDVFGTGVTPVVDGTFAAVCKTTLSMFTVSSSDTFQWQFTAPGDDYSMYAPTPINASVIVVGAGTFRGLGEGKLYALSVATGDVLWTVDTPYPMFTIAVQWGLIYAASNFGMICVTFEGTIVWNQETYLPRWGPIKDSGPTLKTKLYFGQKEVMVATYNSFFGINATSGAVIWRQYPPGSAQFGQTFVVYKRNVIFTTMQGQVFGYSTATGAQVFFLDTVSDGVAGLAVWNDVLSYVISTQIMGVAVPSAFSTLIPAYGPVGTGPLIPPKPQLSFTYAYPQAGRAWSQIAPHTSGTPSIAPIVVNSWAVSFTYHAGYSSKDPDKLDPPTHTALGRQPLVLVGDHTWQTELPKQPSFAWNIPGTDAVLLIADDRLISLSSTNGTILWQYRAPSSFYHQQLDPQYPDTYEPTVVNNVIFVGSQDHTDWTGYGEIMAVNLLTGAQVWNSSTKGISNLQLATDGKSLVFLGSQSSAYLHAYDVTTGQLKWLVSLDFDEPATVTYVLGNLIVGYYTGDVKMFQASNGKQIPFAGPPGTGVTRRILYLESSVYICNYDHFAAYSVDAKTGLLSFRFDWVATGGIQATLFDLEWNTVYIGTYGNLENVSLANGAGSGTWYTEWANPCGGCVDNPLDYPTTGLAYGNKEKTVLVVAQGLLAFFNVSNRQVLQLAGSTTVVGEPTVLPDVLGGTVLIGNTASDIWIGEPVHSLQLFYVPVFNTSIWSTEFDQWVYSPLIPSPAQSALYTYDSTDTYLVDLVTGEKIWQDAYRIGGTMLFGTGIEGQYLVWNEVCQCMVAPNHMVFGVNGSAVPGSRTNFDDWVNLDDQQTLVTLGEYVVVSSNSDQVTIVLSVAQGNIVKQYNTAKTACNENSWFSVGATPVADNRFITTCNNVLACYEIGPSDAPAWQYTLSSSTATFLAPPLVLKNMSMAILSTNDAAGNKWVNTVTAVYITNGTMKWTTKLNNPVTSLVLYNNSVFAETYTGLARLDLETGAILWERKQLVPAGGPIRHSGPYLEGFFRVAGGMAIAGNQQKWFGVNASTGESVWQVYQPLGLPIYYFPMESIVWNERIFFISRHHAVIGYDIQTGISVLHIDIPFFAFGLRLWQNNLIWLTGWLGKQPSQIFSFPIPSALKTFVPAGGPVGETRAQITFKSPAYNYPKMGELFRQMVPDKVGIPLGTPLVVGEWILSTTSYDANYYNGVRTMPPSFFVTGRKVSDIIGETMWSTQLATCPSFVWSLAPYGFADVFVVLAFDTVYAMSTSGSLVWSFRAPKNDGWADRVLDPRYPTHYEPTIVEGVIFLGTYEPENDLEGIGTMYAISLTDGSMKWNASCGGNCNFQQTTDNTTVYATAYAYRKITAFDKTSGSVKWQVSAPNDCRVITFNGGKLFVGCIDGSIHLFDASSGSSLPFPGTQPIGDYGIHSSFKFTNNRMYVINGDRLNMYWKNNLTTVWQYRAASTIGCMLFDWDWDTVYIGTFTDMVNVSLSAGTASPSWYWQWNVATEQNKKINPFTDCGGMAYAREKQFLIVAQGALGVFNLSGPLPPHHLVATESSLQTIGAPVILEDYYGGSVLVANQFVNLDAPVLALKLFTIPEANGTYYGTQVVYSPFSANVPYQDVPALYFYDTNNMYRLDIETGKLDWQVFYNANLMPFGLGMEGAFLVYCKATDVLVSTSHMLFANGSTVEPTAQTSNAGVNSLTVALFDGVQIMTTGQGNGTYVYYVSNDDGDIYVSDTRTALVSKHYHRTSAIACAGAGLGATPIGPHKFVVLCMGKLTLYTVDSSDTYTWQVDISSTAWTSFPFIRNSDTEIIMGASNNTIIALNVADGSTLWTYTYTGTDVAPVTMFAELNGRLYVNTYTGILCISTDGKTLYWPHRRLLPSGGPVKHSGPVFTIKMQFSETNGLLYCGYGSQLFALNLTGGGSTTWIADAVYGQFDINFLLYQDNVIFISEGSKLTAFNQQKGTRSWMLNVPGPPTGLRRWNDMLLFFNGYEGGNNEVYGFSIPLFLRNYSPNGGTVGLQPSVQGRTLRPSGYDYNVSMLAWTQLAPESSGRPVAVTPIYGKASEFAISTTISYGPFVVNGTSYSNYYYVIGRKVSDFSGNSSWATKVPHQVSVLSLLNQTNVPGASFNEAVLVFCSDVIMALDTSSGAVLWQYRTPLWGNFAPHVVDPEYPTYYVPLIVNGVLFVGATTSKSDQMGQGEFYAIHLTTGSLKWKTKVKGHCNKHLSSDGSSLVFAPTSSDSYVYGLDINTGNIKWEVRTLGKEHSSVNYYSGVVYAGGTSGTVSAFASSSGDTQTFSAKCTGDDINRPFIFLPGLMLIVNHHHLNAYNTPAMTRRWAYDASGTVNALLFDLDWDTVYVTSFSDLANVSLSTGTSSGSWFRRWNFASWYDKQTPFVLDCSGITYATRDKGVIAFAYGALGLLDTATHDLLQLQQTTVYGSLIPLYSVVGTSDCVLFAEQQPSSSMPTAMSLLYAPTSKARSGVYWGTETQYAPMSPIVPSEIDSALYTYDTNAFYKIDLRTGSMVWKVPYGTQGTMPIGDGREGFLMAYSPINGVLMAGPNSVYVSNASQLTSTRLFPDHISQKLVVAPNGNVYYARNDGTLAWVIVANTITGTVVQSYNNMQRYVCANDNFDTGVVPVGNSSFLAICGSQVTFFRLGPSHSPAWEFSGPDKATSPPEFVPSCSNPIGCEGLVIVANANRTVFALFANNGSVAWATSFTNSAYVTKTVGGVVYAGTTTGIMAMKRTNGEKVWENANILPQRLAGSSGAFSSEILLANGVAMIYGENHVIGINQTTGSHIWVQYPAAGTVFLPSEAVVYNGNTLLMRSAQPQLIGVNVLTGSITLVMNPAGIPSGLRVWNNLLSYCNGWQGGNNELFGMTLPEYLATGVPGGGPSLGPAPTLPPRVTYPPLTAVPSTPQPPTPQPTIDPAATPQPPTPSQPTTLQAPLTDPSTFSTTVFKTQLMAALQLSADDLSVSTLDGIVSVEFTGPNAAVNAQEVKVYTESTNNAKQLGLGAALEARVNPSEASSSNAGGVAAGVTITLFFLGAGFAALVYYRKSKARSAYGETAHTRPEHTMKSGAFHSEEDEMSAALVHSEHTPTAHPV